jgi:hypothetical protein
MAVLSADPTTMAVDALKDLRCLTTVVDGCVVFDGQSADAEAGPPLRGWKCC